MQGESRDSGITFFGCRRPIGVIVAQFTNIGFNLINMSFGFLHTENVGLFCMQKVN